MMTKDQCFALLGRLTATQRVIAEAADEVHTVMANMDRERRAELKLVEWVKIEPILRMVRDMVEKDTSDKAIAAREKRQDALELAGATKYKPEGD